MPTASPRQRPARCAVVLHPGAGAAQGHHIARGGGADDGFGGAYGSSTFSILLAEMNFDGTTCTSNRPAMLLISNPIDLFVNIPECTGGLVLPLVAKFD